MNKRKKLTIFGAVFLLILLTVFIISRNPSASNLPVSQESDGNESGNFTDIMLVQDIPGLYEVHYNGTVDKITYLSVATKSPVGRQKALTWIRLRGYDLTTTKITFDDYINPFAKTLEGEMYE